jgi:hypothetical protein
LTRWMCKNRNSRETTRRNRRWWLCRRSKHKTCRRHEGPDSREQLEYRLLASAGDRDLSRDWYSSSKLLSEPSMSVTTEDVASSRGQIPNPMFADTNNIDRQRTPLRRLDRLRSKLRWCTVVTRKPKIRDSHLITSFQAGRRF